jgi:hypothetical protein
LAIVVGGLADSIYAGRAWSLSRLTINRVPLCAITYALSWMPLAIMILRPLLPTH